MRGSICGLLRAGENNATTTTELMRITGLSQREICRAVQNERRAGAVIISKTIPPGGYYLPSNRAEVERFHMSMQKRGKNILKSSQTAGKLLKATPGQRDIDGTEAL